jgi:hypothetical protein
VVASFDSGEGAMPLYNKYILQMTLMIIKWWGHPHCSGTMGSNEGHPWHLPGRSRRRHPSIAQVSWPWRLDIKHANKANNRHIALHYIPNYNSF